MRSILVGLTLAALLIGGAAGWALSRTASFSSGASSPAPTAGMTAQMTDVKATSPVPTSTATRGGQPLAYSMDGTVKVFRLTARAVRWPLLPQVSVTALTYNDQSPGPLLQVTQGDTIRVILRNELQEPTTIHWHGLELPNAMDGVPGVTQEAVAPGAEFTYEFPVNQAGTFMYHSHFEATQATRGLGGVLISLPKGGDPIQVDRDVPLVFQEWSVDPATGEPLGDMPGMPGMAQTNFFTINGKAYPASEPLVVTQGQRVRLRLANFASETPHPIHLHGNTFKVVAKDGAPWDGPNAVTQPVAAGETYDIVFTAANPGTWLLHCHIPHHTTNAGQEMGGMLMLVIVTPG